MSNYLIGIDETGKFEKFDKTDQSRIGGVVLKDCSSEELRKKMQAICHDHGCPVLEESLGRLHYTDAKNEKKTIEITTVDGSVIELSHPQRMGIIRDILDKSQDVCVLYFVSSGFPYFFSHEQDAYWDLLRTTLWGILTDSIDWQPGDSIKINIGMRPHTKGSCGEWQVKDTERYYLFIANQLEDEFAEFRKDNGLAKLKFTLGKDKQDAELIMADLVIGNYRMEGDRQHRLQEYCVKLPYHTVPFDNYFHLLIGAKSPLDALMSDVKDGKMPVTPALFALLHLYTRNNAIEIKDSIGMLLDQLEKKQYLQQEFLTTLDSTLKSFMTSRVHDQNSLKIARQYGDVILEILSKKKEQGAFFLRVRDIIHRCNITIASHQGSGPVGTQHQDYRQFFRNNRDILYPTRAERIKNFLDTELQIVQAAYFNIYNFQNVVPEYTAYQASYRSMMPPASPSDTKDMLASMAGNKDAMLGKICGTLGQAHGFLYSIFHRDEDYDAAKKQLEIDTDNFQDGTADWAYGMHYRVHLELCKGNLDSAARDDSAWNLLKKILGNPDLTPESLVRWLIDKNESSPWTLSLAMKFLGYYKHAHPGFQISPQDWESLLYLVQDDWGIYPQCNILKWMVYLAINTESKPATSQEKEQRKTEINLAQKALSMAASGAFDAEDFTIQTMEIPIWMLDVCLCSNHDQQLTQAKQALQGLQKLMDKQPGFRACMEPYGWQKKFQPKTLQKWDLWDIVVMLPYYYA